jgi:hypothetical protein
MVQTFSPAANLISRVTIFGALFVVLGALWLMGAIDRSAYVTQEGVVRAQPVQFSHDHHVRGLGIDCRYCHTSVEHSSSAGMPSTRTCMTCHSQIWTEAVLLQPVHASYRDDTSIAWTRVHDLPDFAYFDHSIHIAKGIGCQSCHGDVGAMPLMWQAHPLTMEWCLACHREPELYVRPREAVFDLDYAPELPQEVLGPALVERYQIQSMMACSSCHR